MLTDYTETIRNLKKKVGTQRNFRESEEFLKSKYEQLTEQNETKYR